MPFEIDDLVYARCCEDGGFHRARVEMVINNGRQYLVSFVNPNISDRLVGRRHVFGLVNICGNLVHLERTNMNQSGGQDSFKE